MTRQVDETSKSVRILVVDDYEPWHSFVATTLRKEPRLEIIARVSDGLEAVQKAGELKPDLILLDIGLPTVNGIEAARRIQGVSPASKIIFVSENRCNDVAAEALSTGAGGYVVKADAARDLLPAVNAVLEGKRFMSASLAGSGLDGLPNQRTVGPLHSDNVVRFPQPHNVGIARHEAFFSNYRFFLDYFSLFVGSAIKAGSTAIVAASESHCDSLLPRLHAYGLDMGKAIEEAGGQLENVIRARIMLTDISTWREAAQAHGERFSNIKPVCTFVEVSGFIDPAWKVEVETDCLVG